MQRREFITLFGGAAAAWPLVAGAQQSPMPMIGLLSGTHVDERQFGSIWQGLNEAGWIEGRNAAIVYRSADGHYDRLPGQAADLVRHQVAVIFAILGSAPALAAKAATPTIPIVFATGGDPIKLGLVSSLNRPGGNVTGVTFLTNALGAKRLAFLRKVVPQVTTIGFLVNPTNPNAKSESRDVQAAAQALEVKLHIQNASNESDIDVAFANFAQQVKAIIIASDAFFVSRRDQFVALEARYAVPTTHPLRSVPLAGGLMSYGPSITDAFRLAGIYVGRILKGEKPADLPVMQSTKFEFVINLKTAKRLGIDLPAELLALADEVIE
jgi:putative ABC transport system substrate-binding protein